MVHLHANHTQESNTKPAQLAVGVTLTFLRWFGRFQRPRRPNARPLIEQTCATRKPDLPQVPANFLPCPRRPSQASIVPEIDLFWRDLSPPTVCAPIANENHSSDTTTRFGISAAIASCIPQQWVLWDNFRADGLHEKSEIQSHYNVALLLFRDRVPVPYIRKHERVRGVSMWYWEKKNGQQTAKRIVSRATTTSSHNSSRTYHI